MPSKPRHHTAKFAHATWADAFATRLAKEPTVYGIVRRVGGYVEFSTRPVEGKDALAEWVAWSKLVCHHSAPLNLGTLDGITVASYS